jgi:hypothetical protein
MPNFHYFRTLLVVLNAVWRHGSVRVDAALGIGAAHRVLNAVWRHGSVRGRRSVRRDPVYDVLNAVWRHGSVRTAS